MSMVTIPMTDGGQAEACLARPDDGEHPGVLFFIDAIGLRPQIFAMAERIASWGYVVLAPNLLWRSGSAAETSPTRDLSEPGAREELMPAAMGRVRALTIERTRADIADYLTFLTAQPGVRSPVGVTGYCMGARLATRAACWHPDLVAAVGGFHGGGLATLDDDSPHLELHRARAEFVYGHADHDAGMAPDAVERLGLALAEADLTAINHVVPEARHGYTMADTSVYSPEGERWHDTQLRALFERAL